MPQAGLSRLAARWMKRTYNGISPNLTSAPFLFCYSTQVNFGTGSATGDARSGADWVTSYVDGDMRLGVGRPSGNTFLFFRNKLI